MECEDLQSHRVVTCSLIASSIYSAALTVNWAWTGKALMEAALQ